MTHNHSTAVQWLSLEFQCWPCENFSVILSSFNFEAEAKTHSALLKLYPEYFVVVVKLFRLPFKLSVEIYFGMSMWFWWEYWLFAGLGHVPCRNWYSSCSKDVQSKWRAWSSKFSMCICVNWIICYLQLHFWYLVTKVGVVHCHLICTFYLLMWVTDIVKCMK